MPARNPSRQTAMRAPESRRQRKKAQRRRRLFESAMALFAERGYDGTTVDDIAEAADVARATFFNYYPSKEAVLLEQHGRLQRRVLAGTEALLDMPLGAEERFRRHFSQLAATVVSEGDRVRVLVRTLPFAPALSRADQETVKRVLALYAQFLADGMMCGELRKDLDIPIACQLLAGAWTITLLSWAYDFDPDPAATIAAKLELIFSGLLPPIGRPGR